MTPEESEALLRTIEAIGTLTLGALLAVLITHRLTISREHINGIRQRRRAFLAFMESWRYEISRIFLHETGGGFERRNSSYSDSISTFVHESGMIKWNFDPERRKQFVILCSAITNVKHPTVYNKTDHDKVIKAFNEIIAFVND